jgi:hypothetical protein
LNANCAYSNQNARATGQVAGMESQYQAKGYLNNIADSGLKVDANYHRSAVGSVADFHHVQSVPEHRLEYDANGGKHALLLQTMRQTNPAAS